MNTSTALIAAFAISGLVFGSEVEISGRLEKSETGPCRVLINSDFVSGGIIHDVDCPREPIINHGKYHLKLNVRKEGLRCLLSIEGKLDIMPPEVPLPNYPNSKVLARLLDCDSER